MSEHVRGIVTRWMMSRVDGSGKGSGGYGFIRLDTGEELFVHRRALRLWPKLRELVEGSVVEFNVKPSPKGREYMVASDVVEIEGKRPRVDPKRYLPGERVGGVMTEEERSKATGYTSFVGVKYAPRPRVTVREE